MSKAARSIFVFAVYLWIIGAALVIVPNVLLSLLLVPETHEVWIRVVGMLALILGYYYLTAARAELTALMQATVLGRYSVFAFFVAFVLLGLAPPMLLVFGVVDAAAATWTAVALRQDQRAS
jgi:hypothetical protein